MNQSPQQPASSHPVETAVIECVDVHLEKARRACRRTRAFMIGGVVFVAAYMGCLTYFLHQHLLQPKPAAELATQYAASFVRENGTEFSQQLLTEVPVTIRRLPDMAIEQLPKLRRQFEDRTQVMLKQTMQELAPKVAEEIDRFLVTHQADIKEFLSATQDPVLVAKLGEQIERDVRTMLNTKDERGVSAMDCLHDSLVAVQLIQTRIHRLATATDLTPEEKQMRRAIAVLLQAIEQQDRA